jgi:hypothetical protein
VLTVCHTLRTAKARPGRKWPRKVPMACPVCLARVTALVTALVSWCGSVGCAGFCSLEKSGSALDCLCVDQCNEMEAAAAAWLFLASEERETTKRREQRGRGETHGREPADWPIGGRG